MKRIIKSNLTVKYGTGKTSQGQPKTLYLLAVATEVSIFNVEHISFPRTRFPSTTSIIISSTVFTTPCYYR